MLALVTNGDARHRFPWHLRRRSEGWERCPLASPAPGTGSPRLPAGLTSTDPPGTGSCALGPIAAPVPPSLFGGLHDCQVPGGRGRCAGGFLGILSTCGFLCHPTLQQACSDAWGSVQRCQTWVCTLPGIIRQQLSFTTAAPLQSRELIKMWGCLLCCQGERNAAVVDRFTPCSFVTSRSLAPTVELPYCGGARCMSACTVPLYVVGTGSPDLLCACRL